MCTCNGTAVKPLIASEVSWLLVSLQNALFVWTLTSPVHLEILYGALPP